MTKVPDSELIVSVPGCEYFKRKVNTALNCPKWQKFCKINYGLYL